MTPYLAAYLARLAKEAALRADVQLQPHQERARRKVESGGSLLIAHKPGLGKGLSSVAGIESLRRRGQTRRTLVLAPAGLRENFAAGTIGKFTTDRVVRVDRLPEGGVKFPEAEYYVASYDRFRKDPEGLLRATGADSAILDEVHNARNPSTHLYRSLMSVRPQLRTVVGLTGSPMSNKPEDLVPIMDIVHGPGGHGLGTPSQFRQRYVQRKTRKKFFLFGPKVEKVKIRHGKELKARLRGKVDFVPQEQVEHLMPRRALEVVDVPMSPHQKRLYSFAMGQLNPITRYKVERGLPVGKHEAQHIFAMIAQARQASNSIHTLDRSVTPETSALATPKLRRVIDDTVAHLSTVPDGQAVLTTNLVHGGVDVLVAGLRARGIEPAIFIGKGNRGVTEKIRQQAVSDYKAGKKKVIVLSGAGSEGLSLDNTTFVGMVDGHWNPERITQTEARGRRIGGQAHRPREARQVQVRRYRSILPQNWFTKALVGKKHSTDEWLYSTAERKDELNAAVRKLLQELEEE